MIRPSEVAFDIDSTFARSEDIFLFLLEMYGYPRKKEQITSYNLSEALGIDEGMTKNILNHYWSGNYNHRLQPYPDSVRVLTRIGKIHPLLFITAHKNLRAIEAWVRGHLPELSRDQIEIVCVNRSEKCNILSAANRRFYVDDCPDIVKLLRKEGFCEILFDQPWNQFFGDLVEIKNNWFYRPCRVKNWNEIEQLIDFGAE